MKNLKKLAMLCTALLATASLATFTACDFFGKKDSSSESNSTPTESSVSEESSPEDSSPEDSSPEDNDGEKAVSLSVGENTIELAAGEYATAGLPAVGDYVFSWTGNATVTVDGTEIENGATVALNRSLITITPTDATVATTVVLTIAEPAPAVAEFELPVGTKTVNANGDGINYTFNAKAPGAYVITFTDTNAFVMVETANGAEQITSGYEFIMDDTRMSITFVMSTSDWADGSYDVTIAAKEAEVEAPTALTVGTKTVNATGEGLKYTFNAKTAGTYVITFTDANAYIMVETANEAEQITSGYEFTLEERGTIVFVMSTSDWTTATYDVTVAAWNPTPEQIVDAAYALAQGETLVGSYTLTGVISTVNTAYSTKYQNVTVTIKVEGKEDKPIQCFRLAGPGADVIAVGYTITVSGTLKNYNGTIEFDAGCTLDSYKEGKLPETDTTEGQTKVSISIADYATANGWTNDTKYDSVVLDDVVTVTAIGSSNTGKYYTSGNEWRTYQSENPTITVKAAEGKTIVSVKITYATKNGGILTQNGTNVASDNVVTVNANSIEFSVGNTGTATNGQVKITAIEVVYE